MTANSMTAEERLADLGAQGGLTVIQRVAICFAAGVIGGLAVVLSATPWLRRGSARRLG